MHEYWSMTNLRAGNSGPMVTCSLVVALYPEMGSLWMSHVVAVTVAWLGVNRLYESAKNQRITLLKNLEPPWMKSVKSFGFDSLIGEHPN